MSPTEAARLLELPANATSAQIEARFVELRAALEEKITKALTPGLQAKYRSSFAEITTAFETLILAADTASMPGLSHLSSVPTPAAPRLPSLPVLPPMPSVPPSASGISSPRLPPMPGAIGSSAALPPMPVSAPMQPVQPAATVPAKKYGGKSLLIGVIAAVIVLGAGGWLVMKIQADNAVKARLEAEARAQAEAARQKAETEEKARVAAAEKTERERKDKELAVLRTRLGELNASFDSVMRGRLAAEAEVATLKKSESALAAEGKSDSTPVMRSLAARIKAQESYVAWLNEHLPAHPAKAARSKAETALSSRAIEATAKAADAYADSLGQLKKEIATAKAGIAVTGPLSVSSNLDRTTWQTVDSFGIEQSGSAPAALADVAFGKVMVKFHRAGWPDQEYSIDLRPGTETFAAKFPVGSLRVETIPAGAQVFRGEEVLGVTPLEVAQMPPGDIELRLKLKKFKSQKLSGRIEAGQPLKLSATLSAGFGNDQIALMEAILENLALVENPKDRANQLFGLIMTAPKIENLPPAILQSLLDRHLAACREIRDPQERLNALTLVMYGHKIARADFNRGRAWVEEAIPLLAAITDPQKQKEAVSSVASFCIYPDLFSKAVDAMSNWFNAPDDWVYRGLVAGLHKQAGNESEARRIATLARDPNSDFQNQTVQEYVSNGATARQLTPVKIALAKGDLAAAQREFAGFSGKVDWGELYSLVAAFMELGDFETPRRLAKLAESEYFDSADSLFVLIMQAISVQNFTLAEKWAASLADKKEKPKRSDAYRHLARMYLVYNLNREAGLAISKVTQFDPADHATDRFDAAQILVELGQLDRARQVAANVKVAFTKEGVYRLLSAAPMFIALGDNKSLDRALQTIKSENPDLLDNAYQTLSGVLCRLGRFDEAEQYQKRMSKVPEYSSVSSQRIAAQVKRAPEAQWDDLIEQAKPGLDCLQVLSQIMWQYHQRKDFDRYNKKNP